MSEILRIDLDRSDRVIFYSLSKESCGGPVGKPSLLRKWVRNRPASEIIGFRPDEFAASLNLKSNTWEYLHLKHLLALQSGLRAALGYPSAEKENSCSVESITPSDEKVEISARILVDLLTDEIRACSSRETIKNKDPDKLG